MVNFLPTFVLFCSPFQFERAKQTIDATNSVYLRKGEIDGAN